MLRKVRKVLIDFFSTAHFVFFLFLQNIYSAEYTRTEILLYILYSF